MRARPVCKVVRFDMGETDIKYDYCFNVVSKSDLQIRDNAIESARQSCNRLLEKTLGKKGYRLQIRIYPHHVLRENPLASGAGADRMSTGMAHCFGKPIGIAARVKKGQTLFSLMVTKDNLDLAKKAIKRTIYKIPCSCAIVLEKATA